MTLTIDRKVYGPLLAEFQPQVITTLEQNEQALALVETNTLFWTVEIAVDGHSVGCLQASVRGESGAMGQSEWMTQDACREMFSGVESHI